MRLLITGGAGFLGARLAPWRGRHLVPFVRVVMACLMVVTCVPGLSLALRDVVYAPAAVAPMPAIGPP